MKVLGIETSCDETAVCLIEASGSFGPDFRFEILGNALSSQAALHAQYGGVFPNLAKREHLKNLPLLYERVRNANAQKPDVIAVTVGPGLEPCLWTGITYVQKISQELQVPVVAVNHMEGHVVLSMMEDEHLARFEFPVLALLISGGHTELVLSKQFPGRAGGAYELVGQTRDDAAGEAFDKVARLLGLGYPGGPEISKLAEEARKISDSKGYPWKLPRPMLHEDNYDFSFSGLKTAVRRIVEAAPPTEEQKLQLAREFEDAVADVLVEKTLRAVDQFGVNTVVVGGGVSANTYIRQRLASALAEEGNPAKLLIPPPDLATDNAVMIALAGYFRAGKTTMPADLVAQGNLRLA